MSPSQSSSDQSKSTGKGCSADLAQCGQGSPHLLHVLSEDGAAVTTMVLAMGEVFVSAASGTGCEYVGFLATGFLNFDMSSFLIFCFLSFSGAGIGASSFWLGIYVWLGGKLSFT